MDFQLRWLDGRARFLCGDRPLGWPLLAVLGSVVPSAIRSFARVGISAFSFPCTADHHLYRLAPPVWHADGQRDFSELDRRLATLFDVHPRAVVIPRVATCSPPWWDARHPDHLVVFDDAGARAQLLHGADKSTVPSLSSPLWRAHSEDNVAALVRHLEDGPFADQIAGYTVTSLNSEEWFHWGTIEGLTFDYSEPARAEFRRWLERRYGERSRLEQAWGREVDFDTAAIPAPSRRRPSPSFSTLDPIHDRDILDHGWFLSDTVVDAIVGHARRVAAETRGRKVFGTFYGYLPELAFHPGALRDGGHLALDRLLAEPTVHFVASPTSYARRALGEGTSLSMLPLASVEACGKVSFHENDVRTHRLPDDAAYGRTENARATLYIQKRELALALAAGQGLWWFDMTGGWFDDPVVADGLARLIAAADRLSAFPRRPVAEIALVLDRAGLVLHGGPPNQWVSLLTSQCAELDRVGAPHDVTLIEHVPLRAYRFLLVPCPDFSSEEAADRTMRLVAGRDVLWILPSGVPPAHVDRLAERTGLRPRLGANEALVATTANGATSGIPVWWAQPYHLEEPVERVHARYAGSGHVAIASHRRGTQTHTFSGVPAVSAEVLRSLALEAGVAHYTDGDDGIFASDRFVGVHARVGRVRRLSIPGNPVVYDVFHDVELRDGGTGIPLYLALGDTALLFRGDRATFHGAAPVSGDHSCPIL